MTEDDCICNCSSCRSKYRRAGDSRPAIDADYPPGEHRALRRHSSHHVHHGRRTRQRPVLHRRARATDGQEDGQPGRPDGLPPLLRRRAGQPWRRHHVLRVPGCPARPRRRGHGAPDPFRVASDSALDFWEPRLGAEGIATRRGEPTRVRRSRRARSRARGRRDDGHAARRRPPRDPTRACAPRLRRRARIHRRSEREPELLEGTLGFVPTGEACLGGPRRRPRRAVRVRPAAGLRRGSPGRRNGPPCRLGLEHGRAGGLARRGSQRRAAPERHDRPVLVPLDLLPRAERRAVRDRDARPGLRDRRGRRPPRRGADPAACVRAPAVPDRARADAAARSRARPGQLRDDELRHLERPAAGEPEGALVLLHGRGADEHDLFPLLDALDPRAAAARDHAARPARAATGRRPLVPARRHPHPGSGHVLPHLRGGWPRFSTTCRCRSTASFSAASRKAP